MGVCIYVVYVQHLTFRFYSFTLIDTVCAVILVLYAATRGVPNRFDGEECVL
jgi:hypothetical protein